MFYSAQVLSKRGPLGPIWIASWSQRGLKRADVFNCSLPAAVGECGGAAEPVRPPPPPPPLVQRNAALLLRPQTRSSTQRRRWRCACRASCCWASCASTCASCSSWRRMRGWRCAAWHGCVLVQPMLARCSPAALLLFCMLRSASRLARPSAWRAEQPTLLPSPSACRMRAAAARRWTCRTAAWLWRWPSRCRCGPAAVACGGGVGRPTEGYTAGQISVQLLVHCMLAASTGLD